MIYEYAIEPQALVALAQNRLACKMISNAFGLGHPGQIAEFPKWKNWRKQFRQVTAASLDDFTRARLEELFLHLQESRIDKNRHGYDGTQPWVANAVKENQLQPFKAIIAAENPERKSEILAVDRIGEWPEEKWNAARSVVVSRRAKDMATAISPLLQNAMKIIFIDPYFRANGSIYLDPFKEFFLECIKTRQNPQSVAVEIHTKDDEHLVDHKVFKKECLTKLPSILPAGLSVKIKRWRQKPTGEKLHNRYVLTNIGGVSFGVGLTQGVPGETDEINLLGRDAYCRRWEQYTGEKPAFDLVCEFVVS